MCARLQYGGMVLGLLGVLVLGVGLHAMIEPNAWGPRVGIWYTAPEATPPSDAIIVLGGNTAERTETGIALFKRGLAPYLVITGHDPDNPDDWTLRGIRHRLAEEGIPAERVIWAETTSTRQDAQRIVDEVQRAGWQRLLIVSNWSHGRRAVCTIEHALTHAPAGGDVRIAFASAASDVHWENWWRSENGIVDLYTENPKLAYYYLKHQIPLGGCWSRGMDPIKLIVLTSLGLPLSFVLVAAIWRYTLREKKLDVPNGRSSHVVPTPRGGGLAIAVMTLALLLAGTVGGTDVSAWYVLVFVVAGVIIAAIGLLDDWWRTLSARARLGVHFAIAFAFVVSVRPIDAVYFPLLGTIDLWLVLGGAVSLLWIAGLINAYNFMDGIDGLAGTQAVLAGSAWALIFFVEGQETLALLAGLLATTSLGFLALNAPPARIFMGDVGSTFLGFALSTLAVIAFAELDNPRLPVTGLLIMGVFLFDTIFTILRRLRNGENLLEAHRTHLYQRLITRGYSHAAVCLRYAILMVVSAAGGVVFYFADSDMVAFGIVMGLLGIYLGLVGWVAWLEADHAPISKPHIKLANIVGLKTDKS